MIIGQRPSGLVRLVLSLELFKADDAGDKFDALFVQEVLVLTLRVLGEETDRCCGRRGKRRVGEVAESKTKCMTVSL